MGVKIKMGHTLAQNGAALTPFRANGAHPSLYIIVLACLFVRTHAQ